LPGGSEAGPSRITRIINYINLQVRKLYVKFINIYRNLISFFCFCIVDFNYIIMASTHLMRYGFDKQLADIIVEHIRYRRYKAFALYMKFLFNFIVPPIKIDTVSVSLDVTYQKLIISTFPPFPTSYLPYKLITYKILNKNTIYLYHFTQPTILYFPLNFKTAILLRNPFGLNIPFLFLFKYKSYIKLANIWHSYIYWRVPSNIILKALITNKATLPLINYQKLFHTAIK